MRKSEFQYRYAKITVSERKEGSSMAVNRVTRIDTSGERWYAKPNDKVRIVTGLSDDEKSQLQRTQL